jgi:hypothetical protein
MPAFGDAEAGLRQRRQGLGQQMLLLQAPWPPEEMDFQGAQPWCLQGHWTKAAGSSTLKQRLLIG